MKQELNAQSALIGQVTVRSPWEATPNVESRRQLLFSARMRFSSETQCIRRQATDHIIEQNLALCDDEAGLSVHDMQERRAVAMPDGTSVLTRQELEAGLTRLVANGRVVVSHDDPPTYKVTDRVRAEIWDLQNECEQRLKTIVGRLFKGAKSGASSYSKPFMECLCYIFSRLGEAYVRQIQHEISADELLNQPHVARAFKRIKESYPFVDDRHFQSAVLTFFSDPDPNFAALKWNLAQNYFVAKCLGLDPSGRLLSREVFGDADIYLDTNVVIEAIEPSAKHHPSFEVLAKACSDLGIKLHVCQISVDELRQVVSYEREAIEKVADKIPEETAPKVKGVLFPVYYKQRQAGQNPTFDELFEYFSEPSTTLRAFYDVEIIDDKWFVENLEAADTRTLAQQIKDAYETRPGRHKSDNAADHDALLPRWVRRERETGRANAWIVTLDHSLPNFLSPSTQGNVPLAIRLDTLLHWLAPIALQADEGQDRAAVIFSDALKYNLLPQENFFEIGDFLAFAEWEWDTKQLPVVDVEGCIRCVKTALPHLNPAEPADRERMSREFNKYLRDPGRKYKGELERLEALNTELAEEKDRTTERLLAEKGDLERELSKTNSELTAARAEILGRDLRSSGIKRLAIVGAVWVLAEAAAVYAAFQFGDGENNFQKVKNAWEFLVAPLPLAVAVSWFLLGKERVRALGWAFRKLISGSDE